MQHFGVTGDLVCRRLDVAAENSEHSRFGDPYRSGAQKHPYGDDADATTHRLSRCLSQAACQLSGKYVDGSGNDEPEDDQ
jgi:hypothetical protein